MAAVRPLGPGPGAYILPTLVGHEKHDVRKKREPQYSFGLKKELKDRSLGPGPGAYKLDNITRTGKALTPAFSLGCRTFLKDRNVVPGPGAHDNHLCPIYRGNRPPAYSMGRRTFLRSKEMRPGPNAYYGNIKQIRPNAPAYSLGQRTGLKTKFASPGPAAYGASPTCIILHCPPKYSMTARREPIRSKLVTPGPDNYDLQGHKPGYKGPAYSFGVKHAPYAPPMICPEDN